jgi:hypothetical protein
MASTSISGQNLSEYIPYFQDGGLITSGYLGSSSVTSAKVANGQVTSAKVATNGLVAANLKYEAVTGVVSAGTPVSAAHTLGKVPAIVINTCQTSGGTIQTTGTHTSAALLGICSNIAAGATFTIYIFG